MDSFFATDIDSNSIEYLLSEDESKHCVRVLRYGIGSEIDLLDGKGNQFKALIIDNHPKRCKLEIKQVISHPKSDIEIHVAMAPTKNMDRVEWFLEKATELGLTKLTFLKCENNERSSINLERLNKIAISAMKQSKRYYLPEIENLTSFNEFVTKIPSGYIGHCYEGKKIQLKEIKKSGVFLIGPEGDFSKTEVDFALSNGYQAVHMSDFRLRTETAALLSVLALL
ncbi:MAG: 16S rRNA (uracil(1498)-N(3))-methyltransferase [Bacteroidetes bacterium]|nr:16S rRNA (uracil(1498)-N(3))-methyltransferase [Bacteroidota bacterium]